MDKKNLMHQAGGSFNRTATGELPAQLAQLSEEALQNAQLVELSEEALKQINGGLTKQELEERDGWMRDF